MQISLQPLHRGWAPDIAMAIVFGIAAAALFAWTPFSFGSASDSSAPVPVSATPVHAVGGKDTSPEREGESTDRPSRPTCAGFAGMSSMRETGRAGQPEQTVGCGIGDNLAAGTQAGFTHPHHRRDAA